MYREDRWNDDRLKKRYSRTLDDAKRDRFNFTDDELEKPYLDKLSHQTKSYRIMRMITLAYYLGQLRAISSVDEGKTPISLRDMEL